MAKILSREKTIAKQQMYCQHYDAPALMKRGCGHCKVGVNYDEQFPEKPIACWTGDGKTDTEQLDRCPKWLRVTRLQAESIADDVDQALRAAAPQILRSANKPKPGFAPLYCAMYPELVEVARKCGYALAVHGSLQRDFDLIAVPWVKDTTPPVGLIAKLTEEFPLEIIGKIGVKDHGRLVWTLSIGYGECFVDLSITPSVSTHTPPTEDKP